MSESDLRRIRDDIFGVSVFYCTCKTSRVVLGKSVLNHQLHIVAQ